MGPVPGWPLTRGSAMLGALEWTAAAEPRVVIEPVHKTAADAGQALVEYVFVIAFIALVAVVGLRTLGPRVSDLMASITF